MISKTDTFSEAFASFQEEELFRRLQDKYKIRPYFQKLAALRTAVLSSSFFLNAFSMTTAFTCVFSLVKLAVPWTGLSAVFSVVFLALLEVLKRITIPQLFKTFFQFRKLSAGPLIFIACLSTLSVLLSWQGARDAVLLLSPPVQMTDFDQVRQPHLDQLDRLQKERQLLEKQTWQGRLVTDARKQLAVVQAQESAVLQGMNEAVRKAEEADKKAEISHKASTALKAEYFAAAALVLDLLLLFAFGFLEYYDYRSLAEFAGARTLSSDIVNDKQVTGFRSFIDNEAGRTVVKGFDAMRKCKQCKNSFVQKTTWQKFCNEGCRSEFHLLKGRQQQCGSHS